MTEREVLLSAEDLQEVITKSSEVGLKVFQLLFSDPEAGVLVTRTADDEGATYDFELVDRNPIEPETKDLDRALQRFREKVEERRTLYREAADAAQERFRNTGALVHHAAWQRNKAKVDAVVMVLFLLGEEGL